MTLAWAAVVIAAGRAAPGGAVRDVALFVHLGSMVVGFGAVLLVDWFGLLWLTGRRTLAEVVGTARGAHVPTWLGFAGLLASGLFLGTPSAPKLLAVLLVGLNGVYAGILLPQLGRYEVPPRALMIRAVAATAISQAAWWTAVVTGFLRSQS